MTLQLSPKCSDEAGLCIHQMAIAVLSPDSPKAAIKLLAMHLQLKGHHVDRSRVSAWCTGHFLGNRQMTIELFQELVNIFWHKPGGIKTTAGILSLASCIGKLSYGQNTLDLVKNLDYEWLRSFGYNHPVFLENIHIPDDRYPFDQYILPRDNIIAILTGMLDLAANSSCPIVISGQAGMGKSTLIFQLAHSPFGQQFEKKRVIYLNGGGLAAYLHSWHQEIFGIPAPVDIQLKDLTNEIRNREKETRQIVLVDDVSHIRFIKPILKIFKDTRSVVILTLHQGLMIEGLHTRKRLMVTMPGFTLAEAIEFYEKEGERLDPKDLADFAALNKTLKGNPLALFLAFQTIESAGLAGLVTLLNGTDTDIPQFLLKGVFLNLQVEYERLPENLQRSFAQLGALKRLDVIDHEMLAALWANPSEMIDLEKTGLIVNQLQASICPFEPVPGQTLKWRLHGQTHLFAKSKLKELEHCKS